MLAGGLGTRLNPLTLAISKQHLPVFDKPLIYYPLSSLMLSNIREILVICTRNQIDRFMDLLRDGSQFGVSLTYLVQEKPLGISHSLIIAEDFIAGEKSGLILGDNIFHGSGLGRRLETFSNLRGAQIFGYNVKDPRPYGVAILNKENRITELIEKPQNTTSKIAVPGLYFFDEKASQYARSLKPSARGELEILDLLTCYLKASDLNLEILPRGTAWFDCGTFEDLHDAATYVRLMQERTGDRVGDPMEVARIQGWIK